MDSVAADRSWDGGGHRLDDGAVAIPIADGTDHGGVADTGSPSAASGHAGDGIRNSATTPDARRHALASTSDQCLAFTSKPSFGEGLGTN